MSGRIRNRPVVSLFHPEMPTIPRLLEAVWAHAFPGRAAAERSCELSQLQKQPRGAGVMLYRRERLHPTGCVGGDGAQ
jgi:hypothetical protein